MRFLTVLGPWTDRKLRNPCYGPRFGYDSPHQTVGQYEVCILGSTIYRDERRAGGKLPRARSGRGTKREAGGRGSPRRHVRWQGVERPSRLFRARCPCNSARGYASERAFLESALQCSSLHAAEAWEAGLLRPSTGIDGATWFAMAARIQMGYMYPFPDQPPDVSCFAVPPGMARTINRWT